MTMIEKIRADYLAVRKEVANPAHKLRSDAQALRDVHKKNVLSTLLGKIETDEKNLDPQRPLTDLEILDIITKFVKDIQATEQQLSAKGKLTAGSPDAIKLGGELAALDQYMPQPLTSDELSDAVKAAVDARNETGESFTIKDVLSDLSSKHPHQFKNGDASKLIGPLLPRKK